MTKVVVVGYGQMFANIISGCISSGYNPVGVFRYEKVKYNKFFLKTKDIILPGKDKSFISGYGLYEINANSVNSEKFRKELIRLNTDIVFIASWGEKFSKKTIDVPKIATINCHPSLLPKYRGPNPYAQVILNNEKSTGVSFHLADENYDTGAILMQKEIAIKPDDTGESLKSRCSKTAGQMVGELLLQMESQMIVPVNQKNELASYQPQISEKDLLLNFEHTAESIDRRIRAFTPWFKCYIPHKNVFFTFNKHEIIGETSPKAAMLVDYDKNSISVICGNGKIMKFSDLKIYKHSKLFTNLYMKNSLKIGDIME